MQARTPREARSERARQPGALKDGRAFPRDRWSQGAGELFRSRATVAAWLARAVLYYWATENLKLGVVLGVIELERQTGTLANLASFTIGTARNSYAGVSFGYTFGLR